MEKSLQSIEFRGNDGRHQSGRVYNMSVNNYYKPANVILQSNMFAFQFTNVGDVKAWVNGMVINPASNPATALGDSRSISAHLLDIYKGNITLSFDPNTTGTAPNVEIVQLYYAEAY